MDILTQVEKKFLDVVMSGFCKDRFSTYIVDNVGGGACIVVV
jgi:hypothetical protein